MNDTDHNTETESLSVDPAMPVKSRIIAGLLGLGLGWLGVHRFYLGFTGIGVAQVVVTLLTQGFGALWGVIEGFLILMGAMHQDAQGRPLK